MLGGLNLPTLWFGGMSSPEFFYYQTGEVFGCGDGFEPAFVPNLPVNLDLATAVYWPAMEGVLLCGGVDVDLYAEYTRGSSSSVREAAFNGDLRNDVVLSSCFVWRPQVEPDSWVETAPLNTNRFVHVAGLLNRGDGNLVPIIVGGGSVNANLHDFEMLDVIDGVPTWSGKNTQFTYIY